MGIEGLFHSASGALQQFLKFQYDDDFLDRLHRIYTCLLFLMFSIIVSTSNYVGKPIQCWAQPYSGLREDYIDTVCWFSNTYWLPLNEQIPEEVPDREDRELNYYQWVPIFLLLQAGMFYVPCFIWRAFNQDSGINITSIVMTAVEGRSFDPDERNKTVSFLGRHLDRCLEFQREYRRSALTGLAKCFHGFALFGGKREGSYLFTWYMATKLLYLINVVGQLVILNAFLKTEHFLYGADLFLNILKQEDWRDTGRFPRVTMCDFEVRVLGNLHRFTVQCVLPVNMFNEKIYIFIWFWVFILSFVTAMNILKWCYRIMVQRSRTIYIKKFLKLLGHLPDKDVRNSEQEREAIKFVDKYLKADGVFVMHLVARNTSELLASEILDQLWKCFKTKTDEDLNPEMYHDKPSDRRRSVPELTPA